MHACTIASRSHLARARVLANSFLAQHPGSTFHTLVLDPDAGAHSEEEAFEVVVPGELLTLEEWGPLWLAYSVLELAAALKPRLLGYILDRYEETATYLDSDIRVYRPMEWMERLSVEHAVVLTPNTVHPVPRDDRNPRELELLRAGVYNAGVISVGREGRPFLDWWWQRLERQCLMASELGLHAEQRWLDLAPALFDCHIVKDATVNVAYWNLGSRQLSASGDGYLVDGEPLTFYHFSGYDPHVPWLLSKHGGAAPRALLSKNRALRRLCDEYAAELLAAGHEAASRCVFDQTTLPNGVVLDERARRVYRDAVTPGDPSQRVDGVPNPLTSPDELVAWLRQPEHSSHPAWLSRYLLRLYRDRTKVARAHHPAAFPKDFPRYLNWVRKRACMEEGVPAVLMPAVEVGPPAGLSARPAAEGINVIGPLRAAKGVGEASRQVIGAVQALGLPVATSTYSVSRSHQECAFEDLRPVPGRVNPFDVNIVCVNADATRRFAARVGPEFFAGRYTVGYWAWELEEFPDSWPDAFDVVDEIWMHSVHAAIGVRRHTTKPVRVFPIPVRLPLPGLADRRALGLPDGFLFLFVFDYSSVLERKNPVGLVRAFKEAFAPGEGPVLVVKSVDGDAHLTQRERLRYEAEGRPDILLKEGYLSPADKDALMAACDCYVSLHRSEGFGLTMAEAMAQGKPTIATGYSGNLEFMTEENSFLVSFREGKVPPGCAPYRAGAVWAEPDLGHAAELLRRVYKDPDEARRIGERARADMARLHGYEARARLLGELLARIRSEWVAPSPAPDAPAVAGNPVGAARQAAGNAARSRIIHLPRFRRRGAVAAGPSKRAALVAAVDGAGSSLAPVANWAVETASGKSPLVSVADRSLGRLIFPAYDTVIAPTIRATGSWEPEGAAWLDRHVVEGNVVVNVGANVGYFSLWAARLAGSTGRVIAIEPDPVNYAFLLANLGYHAAGNVTPLWGAASDSSGPLLLHLNPENCGDHRVFEFDGSKAAVEVPGFCLDEVLAGKRVDVIFTDTQGWDHRVLRGMRETIRRFRPSILCEFTPSWIRQLGEAPEAVLREFQDYGYEVRLVGASALSSTVSMPYIVTWCESEGRLFGNVELIPR